MVKPLCYLPKKQLKLFYRHFMREINLKVVKFGDWKIPDSKLLYKNMQAIGVTRPDMVDAHHIVGLGSKKASVYGREAIEIMNAHGMGVNHFANGVLLPRPGNTNMLGAAIHGNHNEAYAKEVLRRLRDAVDSVPGTSAEAYFEKRKKIILALDGLAQDLRDGILVLNRNGVNAP